MAKSKDSVMDEDKGKVRFAFYTDEPTMELVNQHYRDFKLEAENILLKFGVDRVRRAYEGES